MDSPLETRFSGVDTLGADTFLAAPSAFAAFLETRVGSTTSKHRGHGGGGRKASQRAGQSSARLKLSADGALTFHFDVVDGGAHKKSGVYEDESKGREVRCRGRVRVGRQLARMSSKREAQPAKGGISDELSPHAAHILTTTNPINHFYGTLH